MIDVQQVISDVPHFDSFCSVAELNGLVERVRADERFDIRIAGHSASNVPIHHVRFGEGSTKALFVAFPHCKDPICGMTVFSLMTLLHERSPELLRADVEWHIVPCIDPDGALLNEGWTQQPLSMENYMRNFYVQSLDNQVDTTVPIRHKDLVWTRPSTEARILMDLLDQVRPDFFYSLHNAWTGGAQYYLSRDIDHGFHSEIHKLLKDESMPIQQRPIWQDVCASYGEGIHETWSAHKFYDYLERSTSSPEQFIPYGAASWDYLERIKPDALTLLMETGYVRHPSDESEKDIGGNLRQFKLRIDSDSKFLASILLQEWEKVADEVDTSSPLYRSTIGGGVLPDAEKLCDGGRPLSLHPTRDILNNPKYDREMKEGDVFQACMVDGGFFFLCQSYQIVRLLKDSPQTPAIQRAIKRLDQAFDEALDTIKSHVDFDDFEIIDLDTLTRVQLGSGLVVLNSLLEKR